MNILLLIETALNVLKGVESAVPIGSVATEITDAVSAAIAALEKVHGTDVTHEQLEALRLTVAPPSPPAV